MDPHKRTLQPGDDVIANVHLNAVALGTALETGVFTNQCGKTIKVTGVSYAPDAAVTGDDTDNFSLGIVNKQAGGAGTVAVTVVKEYASSVNLTKHVLESLTVTTPTASKEDEVDDGETLTLAKTEAGNGLELPAGTLTIFGQYL